MTYANLAKALHTEASHRDDEDNKPRKNPSIGAMVALARLLDGRSLYDAFGAPGDWGYETPVGEALASIYRMPKARPTRARISFGLIADIVGEFTAENDKLRARVAKLTDEVALVQSEKLAIVMGTSVDGADDETGALIAALRARVAELEASAVVAPIAPTRTPIVRCGECTAAVGHFGDCAKGGAL